MPYRYTPFIIGEIYHVFNRSIARQPIFLDTRDYQRALEVMEFYSYPKPGLRFSHYTRLSLDEKSKFLRNLKTTKQKQIELLSFCLMPNHLHFLIREKENKGLTTFMSNFQNSYAKYFNKKSGRTGALFQSMFKVVRIETDEQLLHVSRYIHLNPVTSYILKRIKDLETYSWSSYLDYLKGRETEIVATDFILGFFPSIDKFRKFTLDQLSYQRELEKVKHLILE